MATQDRDPEYKAIAWYQRQLIVDSRLQWMLLSYSILLAVLSCTLLELGHVLSQNLDSGTGTILGIPWQTLVYFVVGMGFFFLFFLVQFQISNRIFGPIHRLKKHMTDIGKGGVVKELRLREKDHLESLVVAYNLVLRRLQDVEHREK